MRLVNARRILWKTKVQFQKVWQGQVRCKSRTFHAFLAGEQIANTKSSPKQMRPGPATRAASFVDLRRLPFRHLGQRNDGTSSAALAKTPHLPLRSRKRQFRIAARRSRGSQQPNPSSESGRGGSRNAWATSTHSRAFGFPRQFTLENYRFAASLAAIIVRRASGGPTFSVNSLCGRS
jgi:hypothetical protein